MRFIFVTVLLSTFLKLHAQTDNRLEFTSVVELSGFSKDALYNSGRQFVTRAFVNMKDVTQVADKESGELTVKGLMYFPYRFKYMGSREVKMRCRFRFSLYVKDGKYKYEIADFADVYNTAANQMTFDYLTTDTVCYKKIWGVRQEKMDEMYASCKEGLTEEVNGFIAQLKKAMATKASNDF
jgi:hypothetical protein